MILSSILKALSYRNHSGLDIRYQGDAEKLWLDASPRIGSGTVLTEIGDQSDTDSRRYLVPGGRVVLDATENRRAVDASDMLNFIIHG